MVPHFKGDKQTKRMCLYVCKSQTQRKLQAGVYLSLNIARGINYVQKFEADKPFNNIEEE